MILKVIKKKMALVIVDGDTLVIKVYWDVFLFGKWIWHFKRVGQLTSRIFNQAELERVAAELK